MSKATFETKSNRFIDNVSNIILHALELKMYNSDQNDFQLEFHVSRTLTRKSVKKRL